jgi:hypothetical protein
MGAQAVRHGDGKMFRALASTHLIGQAMVICLGALVAQRLTDVSPGLLWAVAGPAALLSILMCGFLLKPWAVPTGWALQFGMVLAGVLVPMMFIVGVVFALIWYSCVTVGRKIDREKAEWNARLDAADAAAAAEQASGSVAAS